MSRIRGTGTKPEELVRKYLFRHGFRYRKNDRRYPGRPDIVLPRYRTVVFVNGCFWHMHGCSRSRIPRSRQDYWRPKILGNAARDIKNREALEASGWHVAVVWECELKKETAERRLSQLCEEIRQAADTVSGRAASLF